ncbi:MAG: hypothetical protein ACJ78U_12700 [Myxococcales bacterium]
MDLRKLQGAVDQVEREIAVFGGAKSAEAAPLRDAWSRLVGVLALEPPQPMRNCPRCGEAGMRDATVCGYCWMKLVVSH